MHRDEKPSPSPEKVTPPELMDERRSCESDIIAAAYDYALATLGFSQNGEHLTGPRCPDDAKSHCEAAEARLLSMSRRLAPALLADARCGRTL